MNHIKKFWADHKRGLVILGTVATTAMIALVTVNAHTQYLNALDQVEVDSI